MVASEFSFSEEEFNSFLDRVYTKLLRMGWNKIPAKRTLERDKIYPEQSLLSHSINAMSIVHRILSILSKLKIKSITPELYAKAILASFLHDVGKIIRIKGHIRETTDTLIKEVWKEIESYTKISISKDDIEINKLLKLLEEISEKNLDEIYVVIKEHQGLDGSALIASKEGKLSKDFYDIYNLVLLGDILSYYRDEEDILKLKRLLNRILFRLTGRHDFKLVYYRLSPIHGIVTHYLHYAIEKYLTENFSNIYPLLYSADRTFFIIAGDFKVRKENLLKYVITLLERELKKIIINSNLSDTVLIDNDKKYGLVIDPFLLIHLDIDKVMEHAGNFYSSLSVRVKAPTKRSNEKKLRDTFSKLGVELDATYDVVLISRMLNFYYRIAGKAKEFRKIGKKSVDYQIKIWKYIVPESELNKYLKPGIKESEILSIVAGILYNCEIDGKLIKEFPAVEMFSIVGKVIANAIKELNSTDNIIEEYFKEQIGMKYEDYKKELSEKISDCIFLDYDLIEGVEELIASPEAYINSKVIGGSSTDFKKKYVCIMCNISGFGFPLRTQRSGLATRIFTNRNIASKPLNVRWICAICLLECIFRAILFPEKIENNEKRVYLFLMPDVLFTRNLAGVVKRAAETKFGGESMSVNLTRYSESILSRTEELEGVELFSRARRIGIRPFLTTDAHYIMFVFRYPPIENKSIPDSYIWYNSLYIALLFHDIFGGKYLITESFVPPSSGLIYSIKLEDPHSFIRRVLEFSLERKILDSGEISIAEIERIKKLLAGMCIIANTRYIERRGALHQVIPRVLKTFVDYCLPGSKYFAETLSLYATRGRDYQIRSNKSFIESCKILDITKGGKIIEW